MRSIALTEEDVIKYCKENTNYVNIKARKEIIKGHSRWVVEFTCENNHKGETIFQSIKSGSRCRKCFFENRMYQYQDIIN
jgi:hypothetical protein